MRFIPFDYAVRNLSRSPLRLAMSLAGATLVVLLVLSAAAFVRGMERVLKQTGGSANVMLLGAGSEESVERSEISPAVAEQAVASIRGIRSRLGVAFVSPEVFLDATVKLQKSDAQSIQASVRGIRPAAFLVHDQVRVTAGRPPEPGRDEILVGSAAATRLGVPPERLAVGQMLFFDERVWTVCGAFAAPGTVLDAEIWAPLSDLQLAARRQSISCLTLTLGDNAEFDDVDAFAKRRLDLELVALPEQQYYRQLNAFFAPIRTVVWTTAALIALGGLLGGLNTMYAAFAGRVREVGMLQVIGFSRRSIVASLVQESLLAAAAGTLLAVGLAFWFVDGRSVRFSMGVFGLAIDGPVLAQSLAVGLLLGLVGAVPPALRCLRLPIPSALKAN